MLDQLGLDPAQKAKIDAITKAQTPKLQQARESGDFQAMREARQAMTQQIAAVLRPDQQAKYAALREQQRARFNQGGPGGSPVAAVQPPAAPPGSAGPPPTAAQRARGGAPAADLPPAAAADPSSGPRGSLGGPAPAATSTAAPRAGPAMASSGGGGGRGGGAGRMQAMLDALNLDPAQRTRVQAIVAADQPKMRAAFQAGDMDAARAARQQMSSQIEAVLRPDQRAKYAALRAKMRAERSGAGG